MLYLVVLLVGAMLGLLDRLPHGGAEEALRRRMAEAKARREEEARRRNSKRTGGGFLVQFEQVGDKEGHGGEF